MLLSQKIKQAILNYRNTNKERSFYIYDTSIMQNKIKHLKSIMPSSVNLFYAMKANPHHSFLTAALSADITGVEIASLGEGEKSIQAGFKPENIIFTGPGKSPEELEWSVNNHIRTVHIESLAEAYRLNEIAEKAHIVQDILIRLNPDFDIHDSQAQFSGGSKKMGIDAEKIMYYLPVILNLPFLRFRGLHIYAASGVLNVKDLLMNCSMVFEIAQSIETHFKSIRCEIIDFGGGFGIDYLESGRDFSPEHYVEGLKKLIAQYAFEDRTFVLELGRYLTADSGWYCTEILDIKDSRGTKQVITAGGTNHFRRPAALSINHPIYILPMQQADFFKEQESVLQEKVYIGGPLCNSADKIATQVYLEEAHIGDIAVFGLAGAYGLTMSHTQFLSHSPPNEIVI